jgi:hypothetical protein
VGEKSIMGYKVPGEKSRMGYKVPMAVAIAIAVLQAVAGASSSLILSKDSSRCGGDPSAYCCGVAGCCARPGRPPTCSICASWHLMAPLF